MKKKLLLFTFFLISITVSTYGFVVNGIRYKVISEKDMTCEVIHSKKYSGDIVIPSSVTYNKKTYSVTMIGREAFYRCSRLTSVKIPNSVTIISGSAFEACTNLTLIELPNSLTTIKNGAFYECTNMTSIKIPKSVTEIGNNVFQGCKKLEAFYSEFASDDHRSLILNGELKFFAPAGVTSYTIPNSVTKIGYSAFRGCSNLESIKIPNSVIEIDSFAFWDCSNLESIKIPNSVIEIDSFAFWGCSNLISVEIPNSVTKINSYAFLHCSNLRTVILADNLTIGKAKALYAWDANVYFEKEESNSINQELAQNHVANNDSKPQTRPSNDNVKPVLITKISQSDVDTSIPHSSADNKNTFAVIIANEQYKKETAVRFATNDGNIVHQYLTQTLGLPDQNVHLSTDATLNEIYDQIDWIKQVAKAYKGEMSVIFYYAGHGMPDENTGNAYLIPSDGNSANARTCISLASLYDELSTMNAKNVCVFLDACFSGAQRGDGMLMAARGVAIKAKETAPKGNMVVFSAAQNTETAYPYTEQGHGLFTYYLLKKLQESKGNATLGELSEYITDNVAKTSIVVNGKSQTPTVSTSMANWKSRKLK